MNFFQAVVSCFNKSVTFSGRASRSEYWYFFLFRMTCYFIAAKIDAHVLADYMQSYAIGVVGFRLGLLAIILRLFFLLPATSVAVRRLHDLGRSGWWYLGAVTVVGLLPLWGLLTMKGSDGENRFGPAPPVKQ